MEVSDKLYAPAVLPCIKFSHNIFLPDLSHFIMPTNKSDIPRDQQRGYVNNNHKTPPIVSRRVRKIAKSDYWLP